MELAVETEEAEELVLAAFCLSLGYSQFSGSIYHPKKKGLACLGGRSLTMRLCLAECTPT